MDRLEDTTKLVSTNVSDIRSHVNFMTYLLYNGNTTEQDRKNLKRTVKVFTAHLKMLVANYVCNITGESEKERLLNIINNKLVGVSDEVKALAFATDIVDAEGLSVTSEHLSYLAGLKEQIQHFDVSKVAEDLTQNKSEQDLIDICSSSLTLGIDTFPELFEKHIVSQDGKHYSINSGEIKNAIELIASPEFHKVEELLRLREYKTGIETRYSLVHKKQETCEGLLNNSETIFNYFKLKEYIEGLKEDRHQTMLDIQTSRISMRRFYNKPLLSKLVRSDEEEMLSTSIDALNKHIDEVNESLRVAGKRLTEMKENVSEDLKELFPIIDKPQRSEFSKLFVGTEPFVREEFIANITFEIENYKRAKNVMLKNIEKTETSENALYASLSEETRNLVDNSNISLIVNYFVNGSVKRQMTPLISVYILYALCEMRNYEVSDVKKLVNPSTFKYLSALYEKTMLDAMARQGLTEDAMEYDVPARQA